MNDIDNMRLKKKIEECKELDEKYPLKDDFNAIHPGIGRSLTNEEVRLIIKRLMLQRYAIVDDFDLAALLSVLLLYKNISDVEKFLSSISKEVYECGQKKT